jgi:AcrR family transcriptional regulator
MTASTPVRVPQRSHARSNHARILAAARAELSRDPDVSLDEIARAAGVVRRTLYGHFPNRQALLSALAEEAAQSLGEAVAAARAPGDDPTTALARIGLAVWPVGDRYRMLIALGRRDLGEDAIHTALGPTRAEVTAILERGQRDGTLPGHLPAPVLALALEAFAIALLESPSPGLAREAGATALLIAAGIAPDAARDRVRAVLGNQQAEPGIPRNGCG